MNFGLLINYLISINGNSDLEIFYSALSKLSGRNHLIHRNARQTCLKRFPGGIAKYFGTRGEFWQSLSRTETLNVNETVL